MPAMAIRLKINLFFILCVKFLFFCPYDLLLHQIDGGAHRVLERCRVPLDDKILAVGPGLDPDILVVRLLEQR